MDKILNSKCYCDKALSLNKNNIIMLYPCEHMIHHLCYINLSKQNIHKQCPLCKNKIKNIIDLNNANKQQYSDILSVTNFDNNTSIDYFGVLSNTISIFDLLIRLPFSSGRHDGHNLCKKIFDLNDTKITVRGLKKIKHENKVFIANHSSYLDPIIMFYILKCGFVGSSFATKTIIGRKIVDMVPTLIIDRGTKTDTVEKIKEYVKENGSICIFPEGMITHPQTIARFRTGAFNAGFPIYPIVITYDNAPADHESISSYILKICSNKKMNIHVNILNPVYPKNNKFTKEDIEQIRYDMSKNGNLLMSRVSNRDLKD